PNQTGFVKSDVFLNVRETKSAFIFEWDYRQEIFSGHTIRRWLACLRNLLEGVVEDGEKGVVELALLGKGEREQVLVEWNDTSIGLKEETMQERFEGQAERVRDRVAVVDEDEHL